MISPDLVDEKRAAEVLSMKPQTLASWRCNDKYNLPFVKVGRAVRYRMSDLEKWMAQRTATCSSAVVQ